MLRSGFSRKLRIAVILLLMLMSLVVVGNMLGIVPEALRFGGIGTPSASVGLTQSLFGLIAFVALVGFLCYEMLMRWTLRELDFSAAVPRRVKAALDVLSEGVLILDEREQIVLANAAFAEKQGQTAEVLEGKKASEIGLQGWRSGKVISELPWQRVIREGIRETGVFMTLKATSGVQRTFVVNATPVPDKKGNKRGALVTFNDMTALEERNTELHNTLEKMEKTQAEISRQNRELKELAARDSLTGCLNRRVFFAQFAKAFEHARRVDGQLSCIMADIDHFKAINDRYGHAIGDKVIRAVAHLLQTYSRDEDVIGRYGGEEYCMYLPGMGAAAAVEIAERLRRAINKGDEARFSSGVRVTASFGVAAIGSGAANIRELINQADRALYAAKESGRNRVICFDDDNIEQFAVFDSGDQARSHDEPTGGDEASLEQDGGHRLQARVQELEQSLKQQSQGLLFQSNHDSVTGLPNRVLFFDRVRQSLSRARRYHKTVAVVSLDVDLFERVNATLGHVGGDRLLREVGQRMTRVLREMDTVSLFKFDDPSPTLSLVGRDEFGILLSEIDELDSVTWIVKRIVDTLSQCVQLDGHKFYVSSNVGISLYPHDGGSAEALLKHASVARYRAKNQMGRNNWQYFSEEINRHSLEAIQLQRELRHAIDYGEFELYYQPRVDFDAGKIVAMEALSRWHHPQRGIIAPLQFVPVAERTGLIMPVGDWALRNACRQLKTWCKQGYTELKMAVNVATLQLLQADMVDRIKDVLQEFDIEPRYLELEVTESVMMDNMAQALENLKRLHELGVGIALDDFGTGYSALNYLKHIPVDTLKIDRSFLPDIATDRRDAAIVSAIIAMAHSLGLVVVAEGVETPEQELFVRRLGCDELQGYRFSRPLPCDEASQLLASGVTHKGLAPSWEGAEQLGYVGVR